MEKQNDRASEFEKPQRPTENLCPECGNTMVGSNHGNLLTCTKCGFEMGFSGPETRELKPTPPNQDTTTT
jgi:ribosomal protein S27AE